MRLLNVNTFEFEVFHRERPKYVTASHRWKAGEEAMLHHIQGKKHTESSGYEKVEGFARYVRDNVKHVDWVWIDTCCVKQDSDKEVTEAVNSMFQWYAEAELCLAYLIDVQHPDDLDKFDKSVWFRRGWTLQELLAPPTVVFLTRDWQIIGHKSGRVQDAEDTVVDCGPCLISRIAKATRISEDVLQDYSESKNLTAEEKLTWIGSRETTRAEDMYYSLLGIFGVRMRLDYGEGVKNARQRLMKHIAKKDRPPEHLGSIFSWLSPPDPWSNHTSARDRYEPGTGEWLLRNEFYADWKAASVRHLWLFGKAGCGKTVLFSTVVDDIQEHCRTYPDTACAVFYFTFSDSRKQAYADVLSSLVAQLADSGLSFEELNKQCQRGEPRRSELETALLLAMSASAEVFLLFDALDESPEDNEVRSLVMKRLLWLSQHALNCKILVTSRETEDIKVFAKSLEAEFVPLPADAVNQDIGLYVTRLLLDHPRLSKLPQASKDMIEKRMTESSDAMFRWAYCQMQDLINLKSTKKSYLESVLHEMPMTLDETYIRMLRSINGRLRKDAVALLQWIAYSKAPMTLAALAEATIVDPSGEGFVDIDDRGSTHDVVDLLGGLVTVIFGDNLYQPVQEDRESRRDIQPHDQLRLAHFSVKEFLESDRVLLEERGTKDFQLEAGRGHRFIAQSCLTYVLWYVADQDMVVSESRKRTDKHMLSTSLPLLSYSANYWHYHSSRQSAGSLDRELRLLTNKDYMNAWRDATSPDGDWEHQTWGASGLYYASILGLQAIVEELISCSGNINTAGGYLGAPLQAAAAGGYKGIVKLLIDAGADVNAQDGRTMHNTALQAASYLGSVDIVNCLLKAGAEVNVPGGGLHGTALQAASSGGHLNTVERLLKCRAEVDALVPGTWGTALMAASLYGHEAVVQTLLQHNADVNAQGGSHGNALGAAANSGHVQTMLFLLNAGASINAHRRGHVSALGAAAREGHHEAITLLLDHGADVSLKDGLGRTAIYHAAYGGHDRALSILLNASGGRETYDVYGRGMVAWASMGARRTLVDELIRSVYSSSPALQVLLRADRLGCSTIHHFAMAVYEGRHGVGMTLRAGVPCDLPDAQGWTASHWAAYAGGANVIGALIDAGASSELADKRGWTAGGLADFIWKGADLGLEHSGSSAGRAVYLGLRCTCCNLHCKGYAYHCMTCDHYDLCFRCHWDVESFHPQHEFEQQVQICRCGADSCYGDRCPLITYASGNRIPALGYAWQDPKDQETQSPTTSTETSTPPAASSQP